MAWTERYVDSASAGGNGTTSATSGANAAWANLGTAISGVGAGPASAPTRINIKAGTYANTTTSRAFNCAGTAVNPVWWRGYKATPGDQDTNAQAVAGTDIPLITFTTGQMTVTGVFQLFSNLHITSQSITAGGAIATTAQAWFYAVRVENTAANAAAVASQFGAASFLVRCWFKATSSAPVVSLTAPTTNAFGCYFTGGSTGLSQGTSSANLYGCIFTGQGGDCIGMSTGGLLAIGCSFYGPGGNGILITSTGGGTVLNCHFENVNQASKAAINNTSGTNQLNRLIGNSYYNCTANVAGQTEAFLIFDNGSIAASGFAGAAGGDLTASPYLINLGVPAGIENTTLSGYLDTGALQRPEPYRRLLRRALG